MSVEVERERLDPSTADELLERAFSITQEIQSTFNQIALPGEAIRILYMEELPGEANWIISGNSTVEGYQTDKIRVVSKFRDNGIRIEKRAEFTVNRNPYFKEFVLDMIEWEQRSGKSRDSTHLRLRLEPGEPYTNSPIEEIEAALILYSAIRDEIKKFKPPEMLN